MKLKVILHNIQGAVFTKQCDTKKECQKYLDSFSDPENLTGRIINEHGAELAVKKIKRFQWIKQSVRWEY